MVISIFTLLSSCGIFGYSINRIGNVVLEFKNSKKELDDTLMVMNNFMAKKHIN
jgi:hypothetical protein